MVRIVTIDFETYYEKGKDAYTLKNMSTAEYIHDPRFKIIGVAAQLNGGSPKWFSSDKHEDVRDFLLTTFGIDKDKTIVVAHNAMFDGAILEWVLSIKPWKYFCTMMGSRPYITPHTGRMSLASVTKYLELGEKGTEVDNAAGKYRRNFNDGDLLRYAAYCCTDVELSYKIFKWIATRMPKEEIRLLDITIKKFTRPKLRLDPALIQTALACEIASKATVLKEAGLTDAGQLKSNPQFAELLANHGVCPPMKISPTTGKETFAFAKTDPEFKKLLTCGLPIIEKLVAARLKWKSPINETRLKRFSGVAQATKERYLAVPLLYYGAHPGRFSGMDMLNLQNLGRGSALRRAIIAPRGYRIVAGDLSQIEARITAALAGQADLLERFRFYDAIEKGDRDVYCEFGDKIYNRTITKANFDERFVAKTAVLQLGYQAGAMKFWESLKSFGVDIEFGDAESVVHTYRASYAKIVALWGRMENAKQCMLTGQKITIGPVTVGENTIKLPNGMYLRYPLLVNAGGRYKYRFGNEWRDIYGGKLTENVVQALARIVMTTAELKIAKAGLLASLSVHDELIYVIREDQVDKFVPILRKVLTTPVSWMPELPINCEIGVADNYADAK